VLQQIQPGVPYLAHGSIVHGCLLLPFFRDRVCYLREELLVLCHALAAISQGRPSNTA
jgi:hypothetical protein